MSSSSPTSKPLREPSLSPTLYPSSQPSVKPTLHPSSFPSVSPSVIPTSYPSLLPTVSPSTSPSIETFSHYMDISIRQRICKKDEDVQKILEEVLYETFKDLLECDYNITSVELMNDCTKPNSKENKKIRLLNTAQGVWELPSGCSSSDTSLNFYDTLALTIKENKKFIKKTIRRSHKKLKRAKYPRVTKEAPTSTPSSAPSLSFEPSASSYPSGIPSVSVSPSPRASSEPTRSRSTSSTSKSTSKSKEKKAILIPV